MTRNSMIRVAACAAGTLVLAWGCASFPDLQSSRELGERMAGDAYPGMPAQLTQRARQDEQQAICTKVGDAKLTTEEAARVVEASRATIKYPPSGALVGDWKLGRKLVYNGAGERIRNGQVEKIASNGGLCSNCHALETSEINAGNVGPSLIGYGAQRGASEAVTRYTYEKIYNAWAYFPCSNMPRMGYHGFLTPEQITHLVAFLIDPQSPVNVK